MEWFQLAWKRYADYSGRSRRKEYWMFSLINCLIVFALEIAAFALTKFGVGFIFFLALVGIYALASVVPSMSLSVRRLHDTGRSGWWLLIGLVPLFGGIVLFVFTVLDSEPGPNLYGPDPKLPLQAQITAAPTGF
jgi:uncharacterized membrane protein YhaH (DUF805 family)